MNPANVAGELNKILNAGKYDFHRRFDYVQ